MTVQERFEAASVAVNNALQAIITPITSGELDTLRNAKTELETELTKLKADYDALIIAHENDLNRVSAWAEGIVTQISQHIKL